jgi:hypothetical protein
LSKNSRYGDLLAESCGWWEAVIIAILNGLTRAGRKAGLYAE